MSSADTPFLFLREQSLPEVRALAGCIKHWAPRERVAGSAAGWVAQTLNVCSGNEADQLAKYLENTPDALEFLAGVCKNSPFLKRLIGRFASEIPHFIVTEPAMLYVERMSRVGALNDTPLEESVFMASLRLERSRMMLAVALADLAGGAQLTDTVQALSDFADAAVGSSVRFLLNQAKNSGRFQPQSETDPSVGSGLIVLALGKLGSRSLNYSSDIDLIVFFDPEKATVIDRRGPAHFFIRLVHRLVNLLQAHTVDGFVFRVDLRLRPDPRSSSVAISIDGALTYYESLGQNWERAAMIKARSVAGDKEAAAKFLNDILPFVWRRYLDRAALDDIHGMKRRIQRKESVTEEFSASGCNIKLATGGIRDIEFLATAHQLVSGGKDATIRVRGTRDALRALSTRRWIEENTASELIDAYQFLRNIEHRLQMREDEQTQVLPEDRDQRTQLAHMSGFRTLQDFDDCIVRTMRLVSRHYFSLFEPANSEELSDGTLDIRLEDEDPSQLDQLRSLGFKDPGGAVKILKRWFSGQYRAVRAPRSRVALKRCLSSLLCAIGRTDHPDQRLRDFDSFLANFPSGLQIFSLIGSSRRLQDFLLFILDAAPKLAEVIQKHPHVLDRILEPDFDDPLPTSVQIENEISLLDDPSLSFEEFLDRLRVQHREFSFLIAVKILSNETPIRFSLRRYARFADVVLERALTRVRREMAERYGRIPGAQIAIIGYGKLGGQALTVHSDLDIVLVADVPDPRASSDGPVAKDAGAYFTLFVRRLISIFSVPTREGIIFPIDLRLRPHGNDGALAVTYEAFCRYHADQAWDWERMAMTRARVICGDSSLRLRLEEKMETWLDIDWDEVTLCSRISELRTLIEKEKSVRSYWDVKYVRGGLLDIEFLVQVRLLLHRRDLNRPLRRGIGDAISSLGEAGIFSSSDGQILEEAFLLQQAIQAAFRSSQLESSIERTGKTFQDCLSHIGNEPDIAVLATRLRTCQQEVHSLFNRMVPS